MPTATKTRSRSAPAALDRVLSPKQRKSITQARKFKLSLWTGAVSSGKTIASLIAFLGAVADAPNTGLIVIVGRTLQTIERNIIDPLSNPEIFGELASHVEHTTGSSQAKIFGRRIHLIGANDARSEGRIRGSTICLAYVDEATLLPETFWMMLLSRLRTANPRLLATTNPDGPTHWLRKNFMLRSAEVGMRTFEFRLGDNPSLPDHYIRDLYAQYTGLWRRRFIDGEWCLAEGAIYDMFDEQRHVLKGQCPPMTVLPGVGLDYGNAVPFHALMLGVQPGEAAVGRRPRLVLTREYRHDPKVTNVQKTDTDFSRELRAWIGTDQPQFIAVDPSATSFKAQLFRDGLTNVVNAKNDFLDGVRLVAGLLANDQLVIHESCRGLLEELPGYSWDPDAALKGEDRPLKRDDHGCDAARYACATTQPLWRPHLQQAA